MSFRIGEPVKKLPARKFGEKVKVYTDIIEAMESKSKGFYPIEVKDRKPMTVYIALAKKVKDRKDLKPHMRGKIVYMEKL
jgi:hypothetical protein